MVRIHFPPRASQNEPFAQSSPDGANETAGQDVTDIVGQGIVRDRRARLKLPSSQDAVSVLVLVFCGVLVLYPMVYLVVLSVNVGDPQTFPPDEYGIEHCRDLFESWRVIANTAFVACIATVMAILIGFLAAWALTRTQLPGVAWLERLMQLPTT